MNKKENNIENNKFKEELIMINFEKLIVGSILGYAITQCVVKPAIVVGEYLRQQSKSN